MLSETDLLAVARRLCAGVGEAAPTGLEALLGGKNNRVFRLALADGRSLTFKNYHVDSRDPRDRLGAEWTFLNYLYQRGVTCVPKPLAQDRIHNSALYTFIPGSKLTSGIITERHITQAAAFIVSGNCEPRQPDKLDPGSEACFSLADHVASVDRRVASLEVLDPSEPHVARLETLVREKLGPTWNRLRGKILAVNDEALGLTKQIFSPSDVGFHNALVDESGSLTFIDFEYAGRDDPAKLVCDFFCCPEIQTPLCFRAQFIDILVDGLMLDAGFRSRCELLLDAYRIKWACIILNDFLPIGAARRKFADKCQTKERSAIQIDKAQQKLSEIEI